MKKIFKYQLLPDQPIIKMPEGAEILTVQTQRDTPCIWAMVNPDAKMEERRFGVFGTGHEIPESRGQKRIYIGTFQLQEVGLVFHVFEIKTIIRL